MSSTRVDVLVVHHAADCSRGRSRRPRSWAELLGRATLGHGEPEPDPADPHRRLRPRTGAGGRAVPRPVRVRIRARGARLTCARGDAAPRVGHQITTGTLMEPGWAWATKARLMVSRARWWGARGPA